MIVDDSMFMRSWLRRILEKGGYTVEAEAGSGEEAVRIFRDKLPPFVMLDFTMPGMDGISTLKELKAINPSSHIIMCSSMGQQSLILEALQLGATDFIIKPYFENLIPILDQLT